jgi:hypothetical protein
VGKCATCHAGTGTATVKMVAPPHIPIGTVQCDVCHASSAASFTTRTMNHTAVTATPCATCHSGTYSSENALPMGTTHIKLLGTAKACDACHTTSRTDWTQRVMDHTGLAGQCSTCHMGGFVSENAQKFSATHPAGQTPAQCDTCHKSTTVWTGASINHTTFTAATNCAASGCHVSGGAGQFPSSSVTLHTAQFSGVNCFNCHGVEPTPWSPASKWNHSQVVVTGKCANCHKTPAYSPSADGPMTNHIPYNALSCDRCHSGTSIWSNGKYHSNVVVTTGCTTCHNVPTLFGPPTQKPTTGTYAAIHATVANCESCHKSTSTWAGAGVDHTTFTAATNCAASGCHVSGGAGSSPTTTQFLHTQFGTTCTLGAFVEVEPQQRCRWCH